MLVRISSLFLRSPIPCRIRIWIYNSWILPSLGWRKDLRLVSASALGIKFHTHLANFIENKLAFFGIWEPHITHIFKTNLKTRDVAVDAGANIGYYSLLASKLVGPTGRVFAIEPASQTRSRLLQNISLNQIKNISVFTCGAWDRSDNATIYSHPGNDECASLIQGNDDTGIQYDKENIELARLDEMIPDEYHHAIKLLKIDVEGADFRALLGAESILKKSDDIVVLCEIVPHQLEKFEDSRDDIFEFMDSLGFEGTSIKNGCTPEFLLSNVTDDLVQTKEIDGEPTDFLFHKRSGSSVSN